MITSILPRGIYIYSGNCILGKGETLRILRTVGHSTQVDTETQASKATL